LTALLAIVAIFGSPDSLADADRWIQVCIPIFLGLGLVCLGVGTWLSYESAYGLPEEISMDIIDGIDARTIVEREKTANRIRSKMRWALLATFGGIALIFAAMVVSWFV
jgi:hypothetical protein